MTAAFCPRCQRPVRIAARFCARCGSPIAAPTPAPRPPVIRAPRSCCSTGGLRGAGLLLLAGLALAWVGLRFLQGARMHTRVIRPYLYEPGRPRLLIDDRGLVTMPRRDEAPSERRPPAVASEADDETPPRESSEPPRYEFHFDRRHSIPTH
jgi:hypothetical protein